MFHRFPLLLALAVVLPAGADEPPAIEHQPAACTVPNVPFTLCARVTDDVQVGRTSIYFKRAGETWFAYVVASFDGANFCATLPAPRPGKAPVEYYFQAVDSAFQLRRNSTYLLQVQAEDECAFAPVEKDAAKTAAIVVYAVNPKQKRFSDAFAENGVRFVPAGGHK
jgi:hypothetical protein